MPVFATNGPGVIISAAEQYEHSELTGQIIDAFYRVNRNLDYGFLEKVYENEMAVELKENGAGCRATKSNQSHLPSPNCRRVLG